MSSLDTEVAKSDVKPPPLSRKRRPPAPTSEAPADDEERGDPISEAPDDEIDESEPPIAERDSDEDEDDGQPDEPSRFRLPAVFRGLPAWSVSLVVHLVGLLLLALWTLAVIEKEKPNILVASTVEETELEIQDLAEIDIEKLEDIKLENVSLDVQLPVAGPIELASMDADSLSVLEAPAVSDVTTHEIGALFGDRGEGMSTIGAELGAASFFGAKTQGSRFVFVVDNSNSMSRGRFETALDELMKTVNGMTQYQQFYVVFFSDTAYPLFHPNPAKFLVRATDSNKQKLRSWLGTVEMCLKTKGEQALKTAFALQPDVIYILGDGRFTDRAGAMLVAPHNRRVPIHTLGMEVDPVGKREFQAIAKANNGTYRNVSASPRAQRMAKANPIKRNSRRGYVWGLTLPDAAMARKRKP